MRPIVIDFETYYDSDYTIKKLTTSEYIRDPRFETIGVGVRVVGGAKMWMGDADFRAFKARLDWSNAAVIAHHAHFDGLILSEHYNVRPRFIFDTLSMSRALHGPHAGHDLDKLAQRYGLGFKGHEVADAKGKHRADFTPEEWRAYGGYCLNDCELTEGAWAAMMPHFSPSELRLIDLTVKMFSDPVLLLDRPMMEEFLAAEQQRKRELIARVADAACPACEGSGCDFCHGTGKDLRNTKKILGSGPKFAALLQTLGIEAAFKPSPTAKNEDGTPKLTYAFAKTDPFMKGLLEHPNDDVRLAAEARVETKSTTNESRTQRLLKTTEGGRPLTLYYKFAGAHTQRWAGGDKQNPQNFQRGGKIRDAIQAPPGKKIAVADSSQIEARVTAWLTGQADLLEAFRQGRDVYSEFATEAYGRPVNRKKKVIVEGIETFPDFIPGFVGKTCILGLGFGMGWFKFAQTMQQGAMGGPPVTFDRALLKSLDVNEQRFLNSKRKVNQVGEMPSRLEFSDRLVHCIVAEEFVNRYRAKNDRIVAWWDFMNQVIAWMAAGEEHTFGPGGILRTEKDAIVLPNGQRLKYQGLEQGAKGEWTYWTGRERTKIYGGLLTENIVQALARIVVAEQMVEIAKSWRVVLMTHDEVGALADEADAFRCLQEMLAIMQRPPKWAPDLPVTAEGGVGDRYGDAK